MESGLKFIDYLVIGLYLILMLGIGLIFTRLMKSGKDFFVGGRLIPWWVAGVSLYMTLFSAWTFTGAASFTYNTGWFGVIYFALWPIAFVIGFRVTAKRWRRARITTPVEYVKSRFNDTTHLFMTIVLIISSLYWPAHHLASLSKICAPALFPNSMLAIDLMIIIVGIIILFYTFGGGLWAVSITDFVQFLIFISICGVLIPVVFLSGDLGSVSDFISKTPPLEFTHTIRGNTTYTFWYLLGLPLVFIFSYSTGGNIQRYLSVKNEKAASKTGWLAFGLFMFAPLLFGLPPLIGKVLWPDISAVPFLSQISKPDENIFIAVVLKYMPAGMVGLFLAAMMSASMSAMDSAWNVVSAMFSIDIYKKFFKPNASEKETLLVGRLTIIVLAFMAIIMALFIVHSEYGVFTVSAIILGLIGIPVTIPLFFGILTKNISRWSAISSVLAGTIIASLCRFTLDFGIGPQYIIVTISTMIFVFLSRPLGKIHNQNKQLSLFTNIGFGIFIYFLFVILNANPQLSLSTFTTSNFFSSPHFWLILAATMITVISYKFSALYAKDLNSDQSEVEEFFDKLETPIDMEKEIYADNPEEFNAFPLVSKISMILAFLSLIMLIFPGGATNPWINISIFGILFSVGLATFIMDKKVKTT